MTAEHVRDFTLEELNGPKTAVGYPDLTAQIPVEHPPIIPLPTIPHPGVAAAIEARVAELATSPSAKH